MSEILVDYDPISADEENRHETEIILMWHFDPLFQYNFMKGQCFHSDLGNVETVC